MAPVVVSGLRSRRVATTSRMSAKVTSPAYGLSSAE